MTIELHRTEVEEITAELRKASERIDLLERDLDLADAKVDALESDLREIRERIQEYLQMPATITPMLYAIDRIAARGLS